MLAKVMVVEDERIVAFNLRQRLSQLGYEVPGIAASCEEALRMAEQTHPDLVLMDIRIEGDVDGIETATRLNSVYPVPVVYLTAYSEDSTLERARATRPYGYLLKPFSEREMHATIQMALERRKVEGALEESEERLRLALEAAEMGIMDADAETRLVELAGKSAQIFGLDPSRAHASCAALLICVDKADREHVRAEIEGSLRRLSQYQVEFRRTGADGRPRWLKAQGRNYASAHGKHTRMIGVVQDITERRLAEERISKLNEELERRVSARTAELQATVADLDAFSYSVAHDLRSPVRAIINFSKTLLDVCSGFLDEESTRYLDRMHAAGKRMADMIDALLKLSHITRVELQVRPVDLSALAAEVAEQLRETEPHRVVEFAIAPGAIANADEELMRLVLDNLISNAWKFTSKHARAKIEVGVAQNGGGTTYFVRDDGAGFDMTYAHKLFGAFQRLHQSTEFQGTGIGLATVQRIIQRHGGKIWAEAAVEQGATFYFTLPRQKTEDRGQKTEDRQ